MLGTRGRNRTHAYCFGRVRLLIFGNVMLGRGGKCNRQELFRSTSEHDQRRPIYAGLVRIGWSPARCFAATGTASGAASHCFICGKTSRIEFSPALINSGVRSKQSYANPSTFGSITTSAYLFQPSHIFACAIEKH